MTRDRRPSLLEQLIEEEGTASVRRLLEDALADRTRTTARVELNRFDVTIDHERGRVVVEDVLDAPGVGVEHFALGELAGALAERAARDARGPRET